MQAALILIGLFAVRVAIPMAIVLYLGLCQERRCGAAF